MTPVPNTVFINYETILKNRAVMVNCYGDYKKWLRYYLDFSAKYPLPDSKSERVRLFSEKLREKKQSEQQRQQAIHAVFLYFEMQRKGAEPIEQPCHATSPVLTQQQSVFTQKEKVGQIYIIPLFIEKVDYRCPPGPQQNEKDKP